MSAARFDPECRAMLDDCQIHDPQALVMLMTEALEGSDPGLQIFTAMMQTAHCFMLAPEESYAWFQTLIDGLPTDNRERMMGASMYLPETACWLYEHGDTRSKVVR